MENDCSSISFSSLKNYSDDESLEQSSVIELYIDKPFAEGGDELKESETDDEDCPSPMKLAKRYDKEC